MGTMRGNGKEQRNRQRRVREQRKRARRRRRVVLFLWQIVIVGGIGILLWDIWGKVSRTENGVEGSGGWQGEVSSVLGGEKGSSGSELGDYAGKIDEIEVEAPVKREKSEVLLRLEELAEENDVIREILGNVEAYPENLLEALANNPEMVDFAAGYLTAERTVQGGLTKEERKQEHPLFLQWDPRWGYVPYGDDSNIGLAGCGPTCLSMALFELTGDETLTPDKIAGYAMENGYYMSGTGTAWALMEDVPGVYGVSVNKPGISDNIMKGELDSGHVLICAMRPGDFTAAGHFILIYGYDETGFLVNDPNCVARSKKTWSYERIGGQIKQMWALGEEK